MQLYLAVPPELLAGAKKWGLPPVHMAYKLSGGILMRDAGFSGSGGLMALRVGPGCGAASADSIIKECRQRSFTGVVLEWESGAAPTALAEALGERISVWCGGGGRRFGPVVSTRVYRGSLEAHARKAAGSDPQRALADLEVTRRVYVPPCPDGRCREVSRNEAAAILSAVGGHSGFSQELCTGYTAYQSQGEVRFLLYDNAISVAAKVEALRRAGIERAMLLYSENTPETLRAALSAAQHTI